ncbi:DAZP2 protein, partial [Himantopus himantopus]|nr:DAZP2 protein [Himantopus himantopus]
SQLYRPSFVPLGAATVPTMSAAYPGASVFLPMAQSVAVGPIGSSVPMAYYPVGPVYPPGSTVLVEAPPAWLSPQRRPAGRDARSQRLGDATEGKLLPGRLRWRLHYLVKKEGERGGEGGLHLCKERNITYCQHFSRCNCFS